MTRTPPPKRTPATPNLNDEINGAVAHGLGPGFIRNILVSRSRREVFQAALSRHFQFAGQVT